MSTRQEEAVLIERLLEGDEETFLQLVSKYQASMVRVARIYVKSGSAAEEVTQEAWMGLLKGLHRFEGRSSLKTWLFRILVNRAKTRRNKDLRSVPFSALGSGEGEEREDSVDPSRFREGGAWGTMPPERWEKDTPEVLYLRQEARAFVEEELQKLPEKQRIVVTMRDVEGFSSKDVCNVLDVTETHQRVLLHRGRSKIRAALERYLESERLS